jgi:hypothetical protein
MRGLLLGATIVLALIVGLVGASAAHAEGPQTTEEEALTQLVLAGSLWGAKMSSLSGQLTRRAVCTNLEPVGYPPDCHGYDFLLDNPDRLPALIADRGFSASQAGDPERQMSRRAWPSTSGSRSMPRAGKLSIA